MTTDRARRIRELFDRAAELEISKRAAFVARETDGDEDARSEVMSLLAALGGAGSFLDAPAAPPAPELIDATISIGRRIGRYTVKRLIGIGGMGAVYAAEQDQPQRMVALKVMRIELATPFAMRRFEHESQILGSLRHPGIAQIFEAGTHEQKLGDAAVHVIPYFAMELIEDAQTLIDYANSKMLGNDTRLALFRRVCSAIEYAHQRGVIHRDLKPANILVDGHGQPKVIDFGVARVTDPTRPFATIETARGSIVGTLRYMSPEQCDPDTGAALDTRSDVYALGVVLYELLTGASPYELTDVTLLEVVRIVREQPPRPPSAIDASLGGDVETIILKALEKERDRRYASVSDFSADIERFLRHEPIFARPQTTMYQIRRYVRRHRALVFSIVTVFVALVAVTIVTWSQRQVAIDARDKAELARRHEAEARADERRQRDAALDNAGSMRETLQFLNQMFANASPLMNGGRDVTVREVVDAAAEKLDARKFDRPRVEAEIRGALGELYVTLDRSEEAEKQLRRSIELFTAVEGAAGVDTLKHRQALAACLSGQGKPVEDELREIIRLGEQTLGKDSESVLLALSTLASVLIFTKRADEGIPMAQRVVDSCERIGRVDAAMFDAVLNLAFAYIVADRLDEAVTTLQRILEFAPAGSDSRCYALRGLAEVHVRLKKYDEAVDYAIQALDGFKVLFKGPHSSTALAAQVVANIYLAQNKLDLAEPFYAEAASTLRTVDTTSTRLAYALIGHAHCLSRLGRDAEARERWIEGLEMGGASIEPDVKRQVHAALSASFRKSGDEKNADKYRDG